MDRIAFGKRLHENRIKQGLSSRQLAQKVNISQIHINEIERGNKTPSLETFIKICNALKITSDSILIDNLSVSHDLLCDEVSEKVKRLSIKNVNVVNAVLDALLNNPD